MDALEMNLPEFLFGEFPIKNDGFNDHRQFIFYKGITLIEIISDEIFVSVIFDDKVWKQYSYFNEDFRLVYHTNNSMYHNIDEIELLDKAWKWYREYLIWEDFTK